MSVSILLSRADQEVAADMARESYARWRNTKRTPYRDLPNGHLVARFGEIAVEIWMRAHGLLPDAAYRDPAREEEADVQLGPLRRLDVKTWSYGYWDEMGRCAAVNQRSALTRKADAIIWAWVYGTVTDGIWTRAVTLAGWNTLPEVFAHPPILTGPIDRRIENHQVPEGCMRPIAELLRWPGW